MKNITPITIARSGLQCSSQMKKAQPVRPSGRPSSPRIKKKSNLTMEIKQLKETHLPQIQCLIMKAMGVGLTSEWIHLGGRRNHLAFRMKKRQKYRQISLNIMGTRSKALRRGALEELAREGPRVQMRMIYCTLKKGLMERLDLQRIKMCPLKLCTRTLV